MNKQKLFLITSIIFWASLSWHLILTQGLPAGDIDDWNQILRAQDREWSTDLIPNLIRPWSKSKFWNAQTNRDYNRIGHDILLKPVVSSKFGDNDLAYYLVTKAPFFAGAIAVFFILCYWLTRSFSYALFGTLFYSFIPAHFTHSLWLSDGATIANFCVISGFLLAVLAFEHIREKSGLKSFLFVLFAMHFILWFGIRTKESALIAPLVIGGYGLFQSKYWREQKLKMALLFLSCAHLIFLIVPIEHLGSGSSIGTIPFEWKNIFRMVFKNYASGYEDEPTTAFFSLDQIWPSSIARTFGFFLLWTIIIHIAVYLWEKKKILNMTPNFSNPMVAMLMIWVLFEILLMGRFQTDPRYFSGTMIPLCLLATRMIYCAHQTTEKNLKTVLIAISLFSFAWATPYVNLQHVIWLRLQIGQRFNYFMGSAKILYADLFPSEKISLRGIGRFYCSTCEPAKENQPKIEHYLYYWELPYESWSKNQSGSLDEFKDYAEKGHIYLVTYQLPVTLKEYPNIKQVAHIDGINSTSAFEKIMYSLRKKIPKRLYILKWEKI